MTTLRSMQDLRTIRSVRTRPRGEVQSYLEMHRYAEERKRLERELEMWMQKIERIQRRLEELDTLLQEQLLLTGNRSAPARDEPTAPTSRVKQVTLEY